MSDETLMKQIYGRWAPRIALLRPVSLDSFIAALIANESGGDADAMRFEPAVFRHLAHDHPDWNIKKLEDNAHSWGLTQIMGYHYPGPPSDLCDPDTAISLTVGMLHDFCQQFHLADTDWSNLFRCWNTGHPSGKTYDPAYVANGLARMHVWQSLSIPSAT